MSDFMNYRNITPPMTSNTAPLPYVASASSEYGADTRAYRAFNGNAWFSGRSNHLNSWLKMDFGNENGQIIDLFQTSSMTDTDYACWSKEFKIEGSNDNTNWEELGYYKIDSWVKGEEKTFKCNANRKCFRYYKFTVIQTNSSNTAGNYYAYLYNLKLYTNVDNELSRKNANLSYTLPMNTSSQIKNKFGDVRVGLLGMASDPENFGDLYVVGRDGFAHLTKSGIKSEVIFEGSSNEGDITTVNKLNDYKYIFVEVDDGTKIFNEIIYVSTLYESNNTKTLLSRVDDTILTINQTFNLTVLKIIGIY